MKKISGFIIIILSIFVFCFGCTLIKKKTPSAKPALKVSRRYRLCDWLSECFSIDMAIDLASVIFFIVATYKVFCAVVNSADV